MATLTETRPPEIQERPRAIQLAFVSPPPAPATLVPREYRALFADSLIDSTSPEKQRRTWTTAVSYFFQCLLLGLLVILPLMFTEALPQAQLLTMLIAPPPPPPPPPPAAQAVTKIIRQTDVLDNGRLRTPSRIPKKVEMIKEEEAPPPMASGVVGGVPGGVPGGQLNGVIGGIVNSSANIPVATLVPKRIRVSQGVIQGQCIRKVEPTYPKIALHARIQGQVLLKAVIDKNGEVTELQVVGGHPMLIPAALEAVKQWRYRPYLLNGEPVEVETTITVTFSIAG